MSKIRVKKRNGRLEEFEVNKINRFVERTCEELEGVSASGGGAIDITSCLFI